MSVKRCHGCDMPLVRVLTFSGADGFDYCSRICQQRADSEFKEQHLKEGNNTMAKDKDLKKKKKVEEETEEPKKKKKAAKEEPAAKKKSSSAEAHPFRQTESLIRRMFDAACEEGGLKIDKIKAVCDKEEADANRIIRVLKMEELHGCNWKCKVIEKDGAPYKLKIEFSSKKKSKKSDD